MTATPSNYIIGILMFSFIIMGGIALLTGFNDSDDSFLDDPIYSDFNETFNKYDETQTKIDEISGGLDAEPESGIFGPINAMALVAWNTLTLLPTTLGFMNSAINGLSHVFGLPSWVAGTIIAMVSVMIVFAIFGLVFNRET
jgi:hypothetical protein